MTYKREIFDRLIAIFDIVVKKIKRRNASQEVKKINSREFILIYTYNKIIEQVKYCNGTESPDKQQVEEELEETEKSLTECLEIINSNYRIPAEKLSPIKLETDESILEDKDSALFLEIEGLLEEKIEARKNIKDNIINNQNNQNNQNQNNNINNMEPTQVIEHCNRIMKESFDGEPEHLDNFIGKIELAEVIIGNNHAAVFTAYIKTRVSGKALEYIKNIDNVTEIKNQLKTNIKPESARVLENRLLGLRMNNKNKLEFSKEAEIMAEKLRLALISEGIPASNAREIIIRKTTEMCTNIAHSDRIKSVLQAKTFKTTAEVVSELLVQIDTVKVEHQISTLRVSNNYRGRNKRGQYNGRLARGNYNQNNRYNNGNRYNNNRYQNNRNNNNNRYNNFRGNFRGNNNRGNNNWRNNSNNGYNDNQNDNSNARNIRFLGVREANGQPVDQDNP